MKNQNERAANVLEQKTFFLHSRAPYINADEEKEETKSREPGNI